MRKGMVIADTHLDALQPRHKSYLLAKRFAEAFHPDFVVHLGDFLDLSYISHFNKEALRKLEGARFSLDFELGNAELDDWQSYTDEFILIEGNHDERIERYLDVAPQHEGMLEYNVTLKLRKRGIKFVPSVAQPLKIGKLHYLHGWYTTKYTAMRHLEAYSGNMVYGHLHRFDVASKIIHGFREEIQAWGIGCLCDLEPDYLKGRPSGFQNGFAVIYMNERTGNFNLYPVNMIRGKFFFEGEVWQ